MKTIKGYIAITSVLVIAAVILVIATASATLGISQLQVSMSGFHNSSALAVVDSCIDEALLKLNEDDMIPSSVTIGSNTCSITVESQVDDRWTFLTSATVNGYYKSIRVVADRIDRVYIISWQEVE